MLRTLLPNLTPRVSIAPFRSSPWRVWLTTGLPLLLVAALYIVASMGPAIFDQNEAQYAGAVREMMDQPADYVASARGQLERGHWWIPTNDGIPRLQKPPLVYWMLMGSMRLFGVNEFAARLPNALFTLLWLGATFLIGKRLGGTGLGAVAAVILGTMAGTFVFTHLIAPEPYLAVFLALTFWCFLSAHQQPAQAGKWMFIAWVCMGLGVCSKGLHGALYPLVVAGALAWRRPATRPVWRHLLQPAGPLVLLAMTLPWYVAIERRFPGFLRDQFINEQWGHVINRRFPADSNRVPLWMFCLEHLVLFLPWTLFVPAAWWTWRKAEGGRRKAEVGTWKWERGTRKAASGEDKKFFSDGSAAGNDAMGWNLLGWWFAVTAVSLLFSSLQDYYLLTAWVPVAFFLARPWAEGEGNGRGLPRWMRLAPGWGLAGLGVLVLLAAVYLTVRGVGNAPVNAAASSVRDTIFATLSGFSASAWHGLLPLVWTAGAVLVTGGLAVLFVAASGRWPLVLTISAVMMIALLGVAARGMGLLEDYFSLKRLALTANREAGLDGLVVCAGEPDDNPSLLFYLDREIYWFHADPAREFASRELRIGARLFLSDGEFARDWNSTRKVFLICEADDMALWRTADGPLAARGRVLEQRGTRVLVVN